MKTEHIFRFVALRGPSRGESHERRPVRLEDDESFVEMIRERVDSSRPFERARVEVAAEFMNSDRYIMRSPDWRGLLSLEEPVVALLRDARHHTEGAGSLGEDLEDLVDTVRGPAHSFRQDLEELLKTVFGQRFKLKQFAESSDFREMRKDLWHSYYSNLILQNRRPQDRPNLLFWIRLFELIPTLWDDEEFSQLIGSLDAMRPAAPQVLLSVEAKVGEDEGDTEADEDEDDPLAERREEIKKLRDELERLNAARADVRTVFRQKLRTSRTEPPSPQPPGQQYPHQDDADDVPPWRLREDELKPATLEVLASQHLLVERAPAPEIIDALETQAAEIHSDLQSAQSVEEIVFLRGTFVRVRRTLT